MSAPPAGSRLEIFRQAIASCQWPSRYHTKQSQLCPATAQSMAAFNGTESKAYPAIQLRCMVAGVHMQQAFEPICQYCQLNNDRIGRNTPLDKRLAWNMQPRLTAHRRPVVRPCWGWKDLYKIIDAVAIDYFGISQLLETFLPHKVDR